MSTESATSKLVAFQSDKFAQLAEPALDPAPRHQAVIVTCMDCRIDPYQMFGLEVGQVHILRNAGGLVTDDVVRSITLSQRELGTREVLVVQHTKCGLHGLDDEAFLADLVSETGTEPGWPVGGFSDPFERVTASVKTLVACTFLPHRHAIKGYVFDIDSGRLHPVE